jgi:hypothetical protein
MNHVDGDAIGRAPLRQGEAEEQVEQFGARVRIASDKGRSRRLDIVERVVFPHLERSRGDNDTP